MSEHHTLSTTLVHAGRKKRFSQGSVNPVVQRASSLVFETIADKKHCTKIVTKESFSTDAVAR